MWCEETRTPLFSRTPFSKLFTEFVSWHMCVFARVCVRVWLFARCPACQYLSIKCTRYRGICITMHLNCRVRHCVLTLIYSLYKWVNKYNGKEGELEKAHHRPTREETGRSGGLKCNLGWLLKAQIQCPVLALSLCFKDTFK